ncbi:ABC transporter permease [Rhodospirillaceae bacterium SYSU D60014]|uniref:ABC transporter permease n=1 Tax=Virgifigura deserti TaxID=2268457 RepID=UPI000E663E56
MTDLVAKHEAGDLSQVRTSAGGRIRALIVKEGLQIVRDPSSIMIAFVLPVILLFLFGYGVSLDANRVKVGLVMQDTSPVARSLASAFIHSPFFDARVDHALAPFEADLVASRIRGIVVIPPDFAERYQAGDDTAPIQVIADGSQPNTASFVQNYAQGVWSTWLRQQAVQMGRSAEGGGLVLEARFWFNPELTSRNFLVPGSVAIIMTMIGTLLTALVIAREWERGTMEAMMATPVSVGELLVGKIVPYFLLGLAAMALCTGVAVLLFGVPFRGSMLALLAISAAFLCPALGQGLLISAVAKNQFVASQIALFTGFLPAMLLSGFIFEIGSMPTVIRWITVIVPARYFVSSLQTVFLAGDIWSLLLPSIAVMLAIGAGFFLLAARNTRKRID